MVNIDLKYWEEELNYNENITSVFIEKNKLTQVLGKISNKKNKKIIDFGSGTGNAIPFIKEFDKIYQIDFSQNMLNQARKKFNLNNIIFLKKDLKSLKFIEKVDIGIAISSIFPQNFNEFDIIIENILKNIKKNGTLILSLPSFEALTFLYQINNFNKFKLGKNPELIKKEMELDLKKSNYNPFGYIITKTNLIQKYWLKEEILFRLEKYNFKKLEIMKLELNWETQLKKKELKKYPKFWFWLIQIKN